MNVYLEAQGCRVNEAERSSWFHELVQRGHRIVAAPEHAHVLVLNTCAVTAESARKARRRLERLRASRPMAAVVATGCWTTLEPDPSLADLVVPNEEKDSLVDRLEALELPNYEPMGEPIAAAPRTRAFIKVQDGCRNRCTFCIVTVARGEERSRTADQIIAEIRDSVDRGVQEVVLTGIHLGGYGGDLGTDLFGLVQEVLSQTEIKRLRLSSLEPWDLRPDFFSLWEERRLCPHLHLPLQSGSDAVLRRMGRRTTVADFQRLVTQARAAIPGLTFTTDVIAGFPGETERDHAETVRLLEAMSPADLHVFTYSPRVGTAAARMNGQLDEQLKRVRSRALRRLSDRLRNDVLVASLGKTRPVLWERRPRSAQAGRLLWRGHTDNYLRVFTQTEFYSQLGNRITQVRLDDLTEDGRGLLGVL